MCKIYLQFNYVQRYTSDIFQNYKHAGKIIICWVSFGSTEPKRDEIRPSIQ